MSAIDTDADDALVSGIDWLSHLMLGTAGTTVAVLSVAVVGMLMLGGRVPLRRGATVVLGCFIVLSAGVIADGLLRAVAGDRPAASTVTPPSPEYTPVAPRAVDADPYAGASVPSRR